MENFFKILSCLESSFYIYSYGLFDGTWRQVKVISNLYLYGGDKQNKNGIILNFCAIKIYHENGRDLFVPSTKFAVLISGQILTVNVFIKRL